MKPGSSAADVARFLSRASDDACCAWLCETAGIRNRSQEEGLAQAVHTMARGAFDAKKQLPPPEAMLRRVS